MSALRHRFVSLGGDCQPVHHIRRLTGFSTPLFFDWLLSPIQSIVPLIQCGFSDAFERGAMTWTENPAGGWSVIDTRHNLTAHHHFLNRDTEHVETVINIIRRSGQAIIDILNEPEPIVFVRRIRDFDDCGGDPEKAARILDPTLSRAHGAVLLYLIETPEMAATMDNVVVCYNPPTLNQNWTGDDLIYEQNFHLADRVASDLFGYAGRQQEKIECA